MIEQSTIDRVVETSQAHIIDLVSEFVSLKRRGVNFIGHCPFHNERTPSFIVSQHKGIFKCFGCGKGGNAVNFMMEHEQLSFLEAIRQLGRRFNIPIEEKELSPEEMALQGERESMLVINEFASKFFTRSLFETDEGHSVGLAYLRERGFRDDIIRKFKIGYSPDSRDAFTREAELNGYKAPLLEKTGLTIIRDGVKADRFRGRLIFPVHGLSGKTIAFGGRILKNIANTAKYVNSPESEIYHKSKVLYGIFQARQEISRYDRTYLVEGYTDVLAFHQAGISNVVASSGTALTVDQVKLIARFSQNITLIFDGDQAGIKAAMRGVDIILEEGMNVKMVLLPAGEDPDSFAKKHDEAKLREYINNQETDFVKYKAALLLEESKSDPIKRARLIQDIVQTIAIIPDQIVRAVYAKECSTLLKVDETVLHQEIVRLIQKKSLKGAAAGVRKRVDIDISPRTRENQETLPVITSNPLENEEREVLRFLLKYGNHALGEVATEEGNMLMSVGEYIIHELRNDDMKSENPVHDSVLSIYEEKMKEPGFDAQRFLVTHHNPEISRLTSDLLTQEHVLSKIHHKLGGVPDDMEMLHLLVPRVVTELKWRFLKVRIEQARQQLKEAEAGNDLEKANALLHEMTALHNAFLIISRKQGERAII